MDTIPIAGWTNYLSVQAGVAATLTGLVFVAVSINLSRVIGTIGLPGRAAESIMQLFGVVLISTSALIPAQSAMALGGEILGLGSAMLVVQIVWQCMYLRANTNHPRMWGFVRMVQTLLANLPFCICGVLLMRGSEAGLYWLAPGCIFSLLAGVANAWVLLVEILR